MNEAGVPEGCFELCPSSRRVLRPTRLWALIGTDADPGFLRNRIYGNTRPQLTVHIDEIQFPGKRFLVKREKCG